MFERGHKQAPRWRAIHVICTSFAGRSASDLGRPLSDEEAAQVMACLRAVHDGGFLHGDVELRNFCVDTVDDGDKVKLLDLALATEWGADARDKEAEVDVLRSIVSEQQQAMFE